MVSERLPEVGSGIRGSLRERRRAALAVGTLLGVGSALAVGAVAPAVFEEYVAIAVGVGASAYYFLHYDRILPEGEEPFQRQFLFVFAVLLLLEVVTSEEAPLEEELPLLVAFASILLLVLYAVATSARQR